MRGRRGRRGIANAKNEMRNEERRKNGSVSAFGGGERTMHQSFLKDAWLGLSYFFVSKKGHTVLTPMLLAVAATSMRHGGRNHNNDGFSYRQLV
jgi:hypothetical protein